MARNGDGLFRRRGIWAFKYKTSEGVYLEKSTGKRKQPDARAYKHDFLEKLRQHQLPTEEAKWKLGQALTHWIEYRSITRPKASVAAEQTSARHLEEIIGADRRLSGITPLDIRKFQMRRLATVGPKTINNELLVLAGILKSARLWGPLRETYEPLPIPKRGPGKALTIEQTAKLIEAAKSNDKWFVALCASLLAYSTGCRSGEIKTLKLGDLVIDVDRPYLRIRAENSKGRRDREPALNDLALWAVKRLLFRAELLGARSPEHYLLPADMSKHTKSADPLRGYASFDPTRHQTSWQTAWEKLKKAAGIESFRFHDLRHTHITHAIEAGVPIEVVMAQVGHISADMTRYYTHVASGAKHAAVQAIQAKGSAIVDVLNAEAPGSG